MSAGPDIRRPGDIDAAWLTKALAAAGIDAVVSGFSAKPIGTGQIGDSVRFRLEYGRGGDRAPASLVGKFPSADPASFGTGVALGNYAREVEFYRHIAPGALVDTPLCYFTDLAPETGEFVLLMEDLAPAQPGDQLKGVTLDQARAVIEQAARLHASHWNDPWLDTLPWVSGSAAAPVGVATPEAVQGLWHGFRARYGDRLDAGSIEVGERLTARFDRFGTLQQGPRCLTHNDFRPDNMMFATPQGGRPVTVLDWQSFAYGAGGMDVGYFLAGALPPEVRRAEASDLLARYRDELARHGAIYEAEDLARAYATGGFLLFLTAFFAAMIVKQTERGDHMFVQMLTSGARHVRDHDALAYLD